MDISCCGEFVPIDDGYMAGRFNSKWNNNCRNREVSPAKFGLG